MLGPVGELVAPDLELELVFSTLELGVELYRVGEAALLDDGRLAAANAGAYEVLLFSGNGSIAARVGRHGEGPGEFAEVTALLATDGGFAVYDARLLRFTEFSETGEIASEVRLSSQSAVVDLRPLARGASGAMLAVLGEQRLFLPEGTKRDTTPLLFFSEPEAEPDTLAMLPAKEWSYLGIPGGGSSRTEPAFGRDIVAHGLMDLAVIGDTDDLSLAVYSADGTLKRRIVGSHGGWTVAPEEIKRWRADRLLRMPTDVPDWYRTLAETAPYRETHPAFHAAALGPDQMVWIGLATR